MRIELLDHGYVELVESWGSDERIIEAARMSTGKGFQGWGPRLRCEVCGDDATDERLAVCRSPLGHNDKPIGPPGDEKLLAYLWNNKHATPFEMAGLVVEVKAPIMVFREWHRHRTQSYNEMSARYTPLPDENYVPTIGRLLVGAGGTNKQAGTVAGAETLTEIGASVFLNHLHRVYDASQWLYEDSLARGVPKELARICLPVGRYSKMRASANLRNWLAFLTLRMASNAQWEIREYANAVGQMIAEAFPRTWELFAGDAR